MARIPVDPGETLRLIEQFDREPFREALAAHLGCQPAPEALQVFANKYPDRYWQAATMLARMVGYSEAPTVSVSIQAKLRGLSDVEVLHELADVNRRILEAEQHLRKALPPAQDV